MANAGSADDTQMQRSAAGERPSIPNNFSGRPSRITCVCGVTFSGAYSNNVTGGNHSVGSMSYSIWPTIATG